MELIEVANEREFYTKHGQHLNSRGKVSMASRIVQTIEYDKEKSGSHQWEMV